MGGLSAMPQNMVALERANAIRLHAAEVKRQLKDRETSLEEVITDPLMATIPLYEVLEAIKGLSPRKVSQLLLAANIGYARPVGHLKTREYLALFNYIASRHPVVPLHPSRSLRGFEHESSSGGRERAPLPDKVLPTHKNGPAAATTTPAQATEEYPS